MFLALTGIRKTFGAEAVVKDFNLKVERGELVTFLGPSGCGKTTTLRMIAGFETPTEGSIRIDGRDVTQLSARRRAIGMVFQAYALFPNMTVERNIAFGLKVAGKPAAEIKARVDEMLALIKLSDLAGRFPHQLSGGQQQRVSLARALAPSPRMLLLDEPLSALDARIRAGLREEIRALQQKLGITTIFVTHDQEEALSISDRIVVMNEGAIEQIGSPGDIYNRPRTPSSRPSSARSTRFKASSSIRSKARSASGRRCCAREASSRGRWRERRGRSRYGPRRCASARPPTATTR